MKALQSAVTPFPAAATALRPVGILGGMGPEATVLLMSRIISLTPAEDDGDHVPLLVDHNPQVPSRIEALLQGGGQDPGPILAAMAQRLITMGATALAMPCNTAHVYLPAIAAASSVPILDMVGLTAAQLATRPPSNRRIGVLASPAVWHTGIYERALERHGLSAVFPEDQEGMLEAIRLLKRDAQSAAAREIQNRASSELLADDVDVLLIACTELSLIDQSIPSGVRVTDALTVLAGAIVAFSRGECDAERQGGKLALVQ